MTLIRDKATASVFFRDAGNCPIAYRDAELVIANWKAGNTFCQCTGMYGQQITIKLAEVNQVSIWTAEQVALLHEQDRLEKAEDAINGL